MATVTQPQSTVKPFVTVVTEGNLYRWLRFDGRTRRTSSEAFTSLTAAIETAVIVAACYDVPALVPA